MRRILAACWTARLAQRRQGQAHRSGSDWPRHFSGGGQRGGGPWVRRAIAAAAGRDGPTQVSRAHRPRYALFGRDCAGAQSYTLETSSIPPAGCRRWPGTLRTATIRHVRRPTATWADTCSPATATLMDTAASVVSARAALTHRGRMTGHEPRRRKDAGCFRSGGGLSGGVRLKRSHACLTGTSMRPPQKQIAEYHGWTYYFCAPACGRHTTGSLNPTRTLGHAIERDSK